jgi:tetratricopeptide (TPR) repeat protein
MKKVLLLFLFLAGGTWVQAQNNNLVSASNYLNDYLKDKDMDALKKARARIDTAAKHPDTQGKAKTWYLRGKIYQAWFERAFADTLAKVTESDNNKKNMMAYQRVDVSELETSIISYKKELELDTKADWSDEVKKLLRTCLDDYASKAYSMYVGKRYEDAVTYGEKSFDLGQKYGGRTDTNSLNIAAYCAEKSQQYDKSIALYEQLIKLNYHALVDYSALIELYKLKKDDAGLKNVIGRARTAFPNEYTFIVEDLNLAIKEGKIDEAIKNLDLAIQKDPKNAELHLVMGQTYQKMAFVDPKPSNYDDLLKRAEDQFKQATELKPDYPEAFYNYGVFYSNWGAQILTASQKLSKMDQIAAEEKKANDLFLKAIPLLEKSLELDKTDRDTMKALKQLYAKTGQADTEKYKKLNDMLKN